MTRTWSVTHILACAYTVACLGAPASVNHDAYRSQWKKISIPHSVADSHRNISQICFDPLTTLRAEPLNREFIFLDVNDTPGNELKIPLTRQGMLENILCGGVAMQMTFVK
jgi:hypothetical protein